MGGQVAQPETLHIDMRGLDRVLELDADSRTVRVQGWRTLERRAARDRRLRTLAVSIMQTYSSFTVGGSLSVNCHGRYIGLGPLILSVRSIQIDASRW